MTHSLPELPYALHALEPHISKETLEFHYGKHHKAYVDKLNELIKGTAFGNDGLEDLIRKSSGPIFNNASQIWNHTFYWHCLRPTGNAGNAPQAALADAIGNRWSSFDQFQQAFTNSGISNFGSGWTWLVIKPDASLDIVNTSNAGSPLTGNDKPLLTCDVWEHAYYIDYRNARLKYIESFWNLVNWDFVAQNLSTD